MYMCVMYACSEHTKEIACEWQQDLMPVSLCGVE